LKEETDALRKDKEETVEGLTSHFNSQLTQMQEDHDLQTKRFREEFDEKMTKKEEDHADTLSKLEQERKQREEAFADQKAQLD
jgi:hypothetical protein